MAKINTKRDTSPEINQGLSSDDLEALLKFPYDQYLNLKQEENEVEALSNFVLNDDEEQNHEAEEAFEEGTAYDQENVKKIKSCLDLNKNMQYGVSRLLSKVQTALDKNKNKQVEVKNYLEAGDYRNQFDLKTRTSKPISLFASPYFRDTRGMVPPENEDTIKKRGDQDVTAYLQPPRPWMIFEKHKLLNAVYSNCLSYILKPYKARRNYLRDKLKDDLKNMTEAEEVSLKKQVKVMEKEINRQCRRSRNEIITEGKDHIKWHEITLDGNRTGEECEMMWNNYLSIFIKKGPFTPKEDDKLKQLVEKYNGKNWVAIAKELETGRSAIQCFERYQKCLNKALRKKYWTPEEDKKLLDIVESNRIGNFIPWNIVCSQMEGRERHQILNRFERTVNHQNKRTPWTKEEDAMLLMCVKKFGSHWTRMKEYVPGRNPYNIRERYVNILNPHIKCGAWTKAEDLKLDELIREFGYGKWSIIASHLPGRTDNMCLVRANWLGLKPGRKTRMNGRLNEKFSDEFNEEVQGRKRRGPKTAAKPSSRLKIQTEAFETLKAALVKVAPSAMDEKTETINVHSINAALLKNLHKELYKNEKTDASTCWKPRYLSVDGVSRIDFESMKKCKRKRKNRRVEEGESEEDEENEDSSNIDMELVEEKELNNEEIMWLHKVLMSQYNEAEDLVKMPSYITKINLNTRHSAECILYERYLQQKLMCTDIPVEEDDFIFSGNNYNVTLADVAHHFVQPPVSEDSTMVLSPNWGTLNGMDVIQATENRLFRTGQFIHQSGPYIRYLTGRSSAHPKCVKCCVAENPQACVEKFNINKLKDNLIVPDEDMRVSTQVENRHPSIQEQGCCCGELAESKAAAELLTKRFMSLFLWPSLLSSVNLSTEQEELMVRKKQPRRGPPRKPFLKSDDILPKTMTRKSGGSKISEKTIEKRESSENSNVSTKVKRKRQCSTNSRSSRRKVIVKESEPERSSKRVLASDQPLESPLRRSRRSAVLQRRSFAFFDKSDEESS